MGNQRDLTSGRGRGSRKRFAPEALRAGSASTGLAPILLIWYAMDTARLALLRLFSLLLCVFLTAPLLAKREPPDLSHLPKQYREWLELVEILITDEELDYFLTIEENFRRGAFIKAFWKQRDEFPDTKMVELKVHWDERSAVALSRFGSLKDARSKMYLMQGEPYSRCLIRIKEIEVWVYDEGNPKAKLRSNDDFFPVAFSRPLGQEFYRRNSMFNSLEGVTRRKHLPDFREVQFCADASASMAINFQKDGRTDPLTGATLKIPKGSKEWVASFATRTTDLPEGAVTLDVDLEFEFPGRHQQRTVVQGALLLDRASAGTFGKGDLEHHQFLLLGELVREDEIFDTFRYRFELPVRPGETRPLALVFQRYLRPGQFRLLVKLEDLYGQRFARLDLPIEIPNLEKEAEVTRPKLADSEVFRYLREANEATARGERSLRLLSPPGVVHTGLVRFKTIFVGDLHRVDFLLDEQVILSKRRAPFSVELDLGNLPEMHRLRANAYDLHEKIVATDELILNPGGQRFRVHLTEPQSGQVYSNSLRAVVQVIAPEDEEVERVELFLGEDRVATLYQPPYTQPILLTSDELAYVRAVAYLADGNSSEDLVYINAPGGNVEEVHVHFVELFSTVRDKQGRLVPGLTEEQFQVLEDGVPQQARRFEWVDNLPLHTALLIDTSASMETDLEKVGEAALAFVEQTIEPKDRASVISFNHLPSIEARFTNDKDLLARQLKALRASGGTSLYDSLVFALHYFHGVQGQKALLLLSDGKDESSNFDFENALEFARRAGVMIYTIALKEQDLDRKARKVLQDIAAETGGQTFFVQDISELDAIYAAIQRELRSQYLFAYQSTSDKDPSEFRRVEVRINASGQRLEVRTMSGYYP